jgi:hypothetical protein
VTNLDGLINSVEYYHILLSRTPGVFEAYLRERFDLIVEYHAGVMPLARSLGFQQYNVRALVEHPVPPMDADPDAPDYRIYVHPELVPAFEAWLARGSTERTSRSAAEASRPALERAGSPHPSSQR